MAEYGLIIKDENDNILANYNDRMVYPLLSGRASMSGYEDLRPPFFQGDGNLVNVKIEDSRINNDLDVYGYLVYYFTDPDVEYYEKLNIYERGQGYLIFKNLPATSRGLSSFEAYWSIFVL